MYAPASPVTGATQTSFTSPTYTLTSDTAPDPAAKQHAVTALGGTQTGVTSHSVAAPFTLTFGRPKVLKTLGQPNPVTGLIASIPRNVYTFLTRKGVLPLAGQPYQTMLIRTTIEVPAGADLADPANVKAALSAHVGVLWEQSNEIGDTSLSGVV